MRGAISWAFGVQAGSVLFETQATLEKAEHGIREAVSQGAEPGTHLVVGPVEGDGATLYCTVLFFTLTVDETPWASVHATGGRTLVPVQQPVRSDEPPHRLRAAHPPTDPDDPERGRP